MRVLVQKFGGTSLANSESCSQAAARVLEAIRDGYSPVVVVSAMGRGGAPYATDTLLEMLNRDGLRTEPRELDLAMSCGEILSTAVMSGMLRHLGVDAVALTGGQAGVVTDAEFGKATITQVNTEPLLELLRRGKIPVVAGFQGLTPGGEITTLGRGGGDITAVALAGALRAEAAEIYTDVDGVKTADPRLVPEARTIRFMTYDETCQMAHEGAKVLHPRAVEIAMRSNIPIRIRSTFSRNQGTLVSSNGSEENGVDSVPAGLITGVTHMTDMTQIGFETDDSVALPSTRVFQALAQNRISVEMVALSPRRCSFVVSDKAVTTAQRLIADAGVPAEVTAGRAKVCAVGRGVRGVPGVVARVLDTLLCAGIPVFHTSDSHMVISCLIDAQDLTVAAHALHREFGLDRERSMRDEAS